MPRAAAWAVPAGQPAGQPRRARVLEVFEGFRAAAEPRVRQPVQQPVDHEFPAVERRHVDLPRADLVGGRRRRGGVGRPRGRSPRAARGRFAAGPRRPRRDAARPGGLVARDAGDGFRSNPDNAGRSSGCGNTPGTAASARSVCPTAARRQRPKASTSEANRKALPCQSRMANFAAVEPFAPTRFC